jgi:Zn-dependent M16 (insulinase) family peptidase
MGSMDTRNYSYGALDKALNLHLGGFSTFLSTFLQDRLDDNLVPKFVVSAKAMNTKTEKLMQLVNEIITTTSYDDVERLKTVIFRHQSRLDDRVKSNGIGYARTRWASYYSNEGRFNEITSGLDYYRFVTDLTRSFDAQAETLIAKLKQTAELLFSHNNLLTAVSCQQNDLAVVSTHLGVLAQELPHTSPSLNQWSFTFDKKNEGLLAASKVQYVVKGYDYKKLGYAWNGKMRVLGQVLSTDYLHTRIRVVGGAYGGSGIFSPSGSVYFYSYRDPNLKETLQAFDQAPGFLHTFSADAQTMTRYIIGTVARMDRPLTPSDKGDLAFRRYMEKTKMDDVQAEREAVLATTAEDIRGMEKLVADVLNQDVFCVYGNDEKLTAEKSLFNELTKTSE